MYTVHTSTKKNWPGNFGLTTVDYCLNFFDYYLQN